MDKIRAYLKEKTGLFLRRLDNELDFGRVMFYFCSVFGGAEALGERIVRRAAEEDPKTADAALGALALGLERVGRSLRRCLAIETLTAEQGWRGT